MERISASRSHPFFSKGTKRTFAINSSSSLVAANDMTGGVITSCPTFQNSWLYFGSWETDLKSDSPLLHIYHLGTIKIKKQQEVILLGKAQSNLFWFLRLSLSPPPGALPCACVSAIIVLPTLMAIMSWHFCLPYKGKGYVLLIFVSWALRVWAFDFVGKCLTYEKWPFSVSPCLNARCDHVSSWWLC